MSGKPRYAVELKAGAVTAKHPTASFMAGNEAVELDADNARYETTDPAVYREIRDLPFVKDLGEVKAGSKHAEKADG